MVMAPYSDMHDNANGHNERLSANGLAPRC